MRSRHGRARPPRCRFAATEAGQIFDLAANKQVAAFEAEAVGLVPLPADHHIAIAFARSAVSVVDDKTFELVQHFDLRPRTPTDLCAVGSRLFVPTAEGILHALELEDGAVSRRHARARA